jgi:rhodanese-related sulfurtransferase
MAIRELTPAECAALREAHPDLVHVDVRTPEEFAQGHPPGALNVPIFFAAPGGMRPNPEFARVIEQVAPDRARVVLLSCAVGGRSMRACMAMAEAGWQDLVNMAGGFSGMPGLAGWAAEGLPVSREPGDRAWERVRARASGA